MKGVKDFFTMLGVQWAQYVVLTVNIRAIDNEQYTIAGVSAMIAALAAYTIVRRIVKDDTRYGLAGMIVGGGLGDMTGIWLTRTWE